MIEGEVVAVNIKQEMFVKEYLVDKNATQAAIRCGYSEKTAYSQGQRLLKHVEVSKAISDGLEKLSEKLNIDAEYVLSGIKEVTEEARVGKDRSVALKGYKMLGKYLKLFTDRVEHSGNININVVNEFE